MKKPLRTILVIVGVLVLLIGYWGVDNFVYPIKAVHPNYSDVEQAFSKLQFPADWKEISSSENKGLHGRDCDPSNTAGCFHKSKTFKAPENTSAQDVEALLTATGCGAVITSDFTAGGDTKPSTNLECSFGGGLGYSASLEGPKAEVYVSANTFNH